MAKGHKLKTIKGSTTRPTSDRVKESLFNIIAGFVPDADVLDLYAGTGNLGIEALSRGASTAVFVDKSSECAGVIKENLIHTKLIDKAQVLNSEVTYALQKLNHEGKKFGIIFLDPPYNKNFVEETLDSILRNNLIMNNGVIVVERDVEDDIPEMIGDIKRVRDQKYGDTILSFYKK